MALNGLTEASLAEVCSLVTDGTHDTPRRVESGYPLIKAKEISGERIDFETCDQISEEDHAKVIARSRPEYGDTLFAHIGASLGEAAFVNTTQAFSIKNVALFKPNPAVIDGRYLFYLVISAAFQSIAKGTKTGSAQPFLGLSQLRAHRIQFHKDLPTQRRIAADLSAYDDLIENNRRRIKILEEMARSLYREWFVHFRYPGHEKVPLVDSPLGPIPKGWEVKPLEHVIASHVGGGWGVETPTADKGQPAWVIRGTDIPDARYCGVEKVPHRFHSSSNLRSRRLEPGDIIFEVSGGSKGQPVGRALLVTAELLTAFEDNDVICASFCKRIQPDATAIIPEMLYLSFLEGYESGEIEQFQVQSTGITNFKWSNYLQQVFRTVPPKTLQVQFQDLVSPMIRQVSVLGLQSDNLRRTRDLLLPRLLSGQVNLGEN
jgi:type I restriction enzyme, S subunit